MEKNSFETHYGENTLFIKDNDKTYVIDLVEGTVQRFSGKMKKGQKVEIIGLREGIINTKTAWAKKLEEEKTKEKTNSQWKRVRTFLREKSIAGDKVVSLEKILNTLKITLEELEPIIKFLKNEGIIFSPKAGFVSLI